MKISVLAIALAACNPVLTLPTPGTPVEVIERCAEDVGAHQQAQIATAVLGSVGLALILSGVIINNGHNATETYALATPGAVVSAAGLGVGGIVSPGILRQYIDDGCAAVTGPMPYAKPRNMSEVEKRP